MRGVCDGQSQLLRLHRDSVTFQIAAVSNPLAGALVTVTIIIGIGTLLFGAAMLGHPRFGKVVGIAGMVVGGVIILGFNVATFPDPPGEAGLFDPGPVTGLWYLWVVILTFRSFGWADRRLAVEKDAS